MFDGAAGETGHAELVELVVDEATGAEPQEEIQRGQNDDQSDERPAEGCGSGKEGGYSSQQDDPAETLSEAMWFGIIHDDARLHQSRRPQDVLVDALEQR